MKKMIMKKLPRVTDETPVGTRVTCKTWQNETRTGVFTGGIAENKLVNRHAITTDELGSGERRYECAVDGRTGSVVWVDELYVLPADA